MTKLKKLEQTAISRFRAFEPDDGYYLAYSGGKDSDCVKILAGLAGVKFEAVHNLTTVDAPETVRYIKSQPDIKIDRAHDEDGNPVTMWSLIVKKGIPPTREKRYCCNVLKERGGAGRLTVTGVRWYESTNRQENAGLVKIIGKPKGTRKLANELNADYKVTRQGGLILNDDNDVSRRMSEYCYRTRKTILNPIIEWTDGDVWEFLRYYGCESNPLYQCGHKRVGCIGCPLQGPKGMLRDFEQYPKYKQNYIRAFDRMVEKHRHKRKDWTDAFTDGQSVYDWWTGSMSGQLSIFDYLEEENDG